jgi:enoyl-CoA hydratase
MDFKQLKTQIQDSILILTVSRPEKLNALNQATMDEISVCFKWVEENEKIRAVIVTGDGDRSFVAGADIGEFLEIDGPVGKMLSKKGQDIFFQIENCTKPVLAAVNGFAFGGGCELALACHMRIASENAFFAQPEINLGIIPGYGGTQRLTKLVGKGIALEMMLTADKIDAQKALEIGLVNYVVSQAELLPFAQKLLAKIVAKPPIAVAQTIAAANKAMHPDGYETEAQNFSNCTASNDFKEGTIAFLEKRQAQFTGR